MRPSRGMVALLALLAGCGQRQSAPGRRLVLVEAPAGAARVTAEPSLRYPHGSRVVLVDRERPAEVLARLSEGLDAAGGASLSPDARRLLFVARESGQEDFDVWTCRPDGTDRRRAVDGPFDCGAAAFLPDGRIVYSAKTGRRSRFSGAPEWALFVADGDGRPGRRITFSGGQDLDPALLRDGRIVYSTWLPPGDGRPEGGGYALFTTHPDGTGAAPLHGVHDGGALRLSPRQSVHGDLYWIASGPGEGTWVAGTDGRAPMEGGFRLDAGGGAWAVDSASDGSLLLGGAERGLVRLDPETRAVEVLVPAAPGRTVLQGLEVRARRAPQGHLSMVDEKQEQGTLLCLDARLPDGRGASVRLRAPRGAAGGGGQDRLGEVGLDADGSFFCRVPADRPLTLDLLDGQGRVLAAGHATFWVRPREIRCCVGCHEDPETAPPNRQPLAVRRAPVVLAEPRFAEAGR